MQFRETSLVLRRKRFASARTVAVAGGLVLAVVLCGAGSARADDTLASPVLKSALVSAVTISDARTEVVALDRPASDCVTTGPGARMEVPRPIDGSGRYALKLIGSRAGGTAPCEVWAWARVKVFASVSVVRRAIRAGEIVSPAIEMVEREIKPGHVPAVIGEGAVADRALGVGQMIEAGAVHAPGLKAGESIKVLIIAGALAVEQVGHAVPCAKNHDCAVLPSGKHVEGTVANGRLIVQLP